jgi:hypothetical protein
VKHHIDAIGEDTAHQRRIRHAAAVPTQAGIVWQAVDVGVQYQQRTNDLPAQTAAREQTTQQFATDKAIGSGNQYTHGRSLAVGFDDTLIDRTKQ